jgi:putative tryptophan/tyrosine transport system substrate-binding protein
MRRREFITLLGGAAVAWPCVARTQQPAIPVIGFLNGEKSAEYTRYVEAFRRGLNEAGIIEDQNARVEFRWAEGHPDRLPALAADLVRSQVAVIVATGGSNLSAKAATTTIPIVCAVGADPVKLGLVASINRPGGNITGVSVFTTTLEAKRLGLLHELVPKAPLFGILFDPNWPGATDQLPEIEAAARAIPQAIQVLNVSNEGDIDAAFAAFVKARVGALSVSGGPFFISRRDQIIALAARHAIPAAYELREFAVAGGLMSYGPSLPDVYRQIGIYAGRILKGEKPADLPVIQPTKFEFLINLKTAKALGLDIPPTLLALADEVIE